MTENKKIAALVLAAGMGTRLGLGPKAFLRLGDESLLRRVVRLVSPLVDRVLVGLPPAHLERGRSELVGLHPVEVHPGGSTRQETVRLLLQQCVEPHILIHDVARPFASEELMMRVVAAGRTSEAVVAATPLNTPIAVCEEGLIVEYDPRSRIFNVQTPQIYQRELLERAYRLADAENVCRQSTWQLIRDLDIAPRIVRGEAANIKITTALDWMVATDALYPALEKGDR